MDTGRPDWWKVPEAVDEESFEAKPRQAPSPVETLVLPEDWTPADAPAEAMAEVTPDVTPDGNPCNPEPEEPIPVPVSEAAQEVSPNPELAQPAEPGPPSCAPAASAAQVPGAAAMARDCTKFTDVRGGAAIDTAVGILVVTATPQPVRLKQMFPLKEPRTLLGRSRRCGCVLDDRSVADTHALITHELEDGTGVFILHPQDDCPATLNGVPLAERQRLSNGDRIGLGLTELVFLRTDIRRNPQ